MQLCASLVAIVLVIGTSGRAPGAAPPQEKPEKKQEQPAAAQAAPATGADAEVSTFKPEELEQMLAPIALYPDTLLSQVLMASTYPLEIVLADRWAKAHKDQKGDAAAKALEAESWDASVKSLVSVPDVLSMLSEKLDWTQKLGDAFLGQKEAVMATIQTLRTKAKDNGQLASSDQQKVEVQKQGSTEVIVIESTNPEVIYVKTYDPVVVYGAWPYPAYPPYPYYPPAYAAGVGIAVGFAWGYAWGSCNWGGSDVDIDINRNTNINNNIDRSKYKNSGRGSGSWKHDPSHRKGTPYRSPSTAQRYGGKTPSQAASSRDSYRGRSGTTSPSTANRATTGAGTGGSRGSQAQRPTPKSTPRPSALEGVNRGGQSARSSSSRGSASRGSRGGGGGRGGRR